MLLSGRMLKSNYWLIVWGHGLINYHKMKIVVLTILENPIPIAEAQTKDLLVR